MSLYSRIFKKGKGDATTVARPDGDDSDGAPSDDFSKATRSTPPVGQPTSKTTHRAMVIPSENGTVPRQSEPPPRASQRASSGSTPSVGTPAPPMPRPQAPVYDSRAVVTAATVSIGTSMTSAAPPPPPPPPPPPAATPESAQAASRSPARVAKPVESEPPLNWDFLPAQDEPAQAPGPAPTRTSRSRPALKVDWAEAGPSPLASAPVNTPQPIHSPLRASGTSPGSSPPRPSTGPISDLDAALADVDARFDEMMSGEAIVPHPDEAPPDLSDVRELFAQIASGYMRQVRDFIIELQWGETPREWIAICRPSVTSLRKASEQMRMTGLCAGLDDFLGALELVSASGGAAIGGEGRDLLLTTYRVLSELLPQTFALGEERNQREAIIVHSLLQQVPDVGKVTIDKLYAAGLGALDMMFVAKPDDVASAAGIERLLAERIVQRFRWYRTEIESASPDESRTFERRRLEELVRDLRLRHQEYEEAAATPTDDGSRRKRDLRQARAALVSEVAVVLARLGEVQLVRDLERLAFDRKIDILERRLRALESESS